MTIKFLRRRSTRWVVVGILGLTFLLVIFRSNDNPASKNGVRGGDDGRSHKALFFKKPGGQRDGYDLNSIDTCPRLEEAQADINTLDVYRNFNFHVSHFLD
jgi:hypothetical protein